MNQSDTTRRTLAKAVSWQASGLVTMLLIGYLVTGSVSAGGTIAFVSMAAGFVCYFMHERLWSRISWGRQPASNM